MALTNCPECGRQVSDQAEACPSCGRKLRSASNPLVVVLAVIAVALLGVGGVLLNGGLTPGRLPSTTFPDVGTPGVRISHGRVVEYDQHGHKVLEGNPEEAERRFNSRPGVKATFRSH